MTKTMLTLAAVLSLSAPAAAAASGGKKPASVPAPAPKEDKAFAKEDAIAAAEKFIADQGYTSQPAAVSMDGLVKDPHDAGGSSAAILQARRGTLEPKAAGTRFDSDLWFVGFRSKSGGRLRAVRMDDKGDGIKFVSQSIQPDWLAGNDPKPEPISREDAKAIAKRFVEAQEARGLAKEPSKVEEHQPDDKDRWEAWWAYFPKAGAKKDAELRSGEYALVSVHKLSREPKWVMELKAPAPKPAPKAAPKPALKKKAY